jgi:ketosteroid isomerase-like protein
MSQENVEVVRRIYEAWAQGDFRARIGDLDQHVVLVIQPDFPEFGVFLGLDGVRDYMRRFLEQWESLTIQATNLRAVGDTVLAQIVQHGKGRASGIEGDNHYFQLFTFRGKRIVRMESIMDEAAALEALGLSEQAAHSDS